MIVPVLPPGYIPADGRTIPRYGPWERKFIWFAKLNGTWVIMRTVWRRHDVFGFMWLKKSDEYDYALNDFELLAKGGIF